MIRQKLMMLVRLVLCSLLTLLVQSQPLTVTWRGYDIINRPTLIYHDEVEVATYSPPPTLSNPYGPGGLLCNSTVGNIAWHPGDGTMTIFDANRNARVIYQIIPSGNLMAQIVRDGRDTDISSTRYHNGLFTCQRNRDISTAVPVGFYVRGLGVITITGVSIISSSFTATSPNFTLAGDTEGGPPETFIWTRNGAPITGGSFSISIGVNGVTEPSAYDNSRYRSTLTVTGRLPGVYQYSVSNRATPNTVTSNFIIEGSISAVPTNLMAQQNGINSVLVSWTAPSSPPSMGYQIRIDSTNFSADINTTSTATSSTILLKPGVHNIRLKAPSQHYPTDEVVGPVTVTVKDFVMQTVMSSSITATSVTITWSQSEGSLAADDYTISLQQLTGSNRQLCSEVVDRRPAVTTTSTSMNFTDLHEFSIYTVRVTARVFDVLRTSTYEVITLPAAPAGSPQGITPSVSARSVSVSWNEIECIERNGMITNYTVEFSSLGGSVVPGMLMVDERRFTASGLSPFTNYTFRIAGVNSNGTGPFSNITTIKTAEDIPGPVSDLRSTLKFTSIGITWDYPQEPKGIILRYGITYTINSSAPVTNRTLNTTFIIPALNPGTRVSVSISAYTNIGRGEAANLTDLMTLNKPSVVMNVEVKIIDGTSVVVFWDRINITEITNYTVYYSAIGSRKGQVDEQSLTVPSTVNSAVIGNLRSNVAYTFQVAAVVHEGGRKIQGTRSVITSSSTRTLPSTGETYARDISISVMVTFLTVTLGIILIALCILACKRTKKDTKDIETEAPNEVTSVGTGGKMNETVCVAYKHVQKDHDFVPSEDVYVNITT